MLLGKEDMVTKMECHSQQKALTKKACMALKTIVKKAEKYLKIDDIL